MNPPQEGGLPIEDRDVISTSPTPKLPPAGNRVERIANHTKALVEDMTTWVELKMKLTQLEIEQKIDEQANKVALYIAIGLFGGLGAFFALVTLALGLGAWLGHPGWGFLIVTILMLGVAGLLYASRPHLMGEKKHTAEIEKKKRAAKEAKPVSP